MFSSYYLLSQEVSRANSTNNYTPITGLVNYLHTLCKYIHYYLQLFSC